MTKAQRIRDLHAKGKTTREIADEIGCTVTYARVVAHQRPDGSSRWDKAWAKYANKLYYENGNRDAARKARRKAYRSARKAGASSYEAVAKAGAAYSLVMRKTGCAALARARQGAPS